VLAWWPGAKREPDVDLVVEVEAPPPVVLVVDDDADIRSWLNVALSATGWRVHEAGSGAEALEFTANQLPDVIVLDQRMPGMTGLECAAEMRSRGLELPVLLISAFLTADAVTEAERLNVLSAPKVNPALILGTVELLRGQIHTRPVIDLTTSPEPSPVHTS
jgi:CheY-like chemotaxis protein